jgi:CheY-like chemotaxis protein
MHILLVENHLDTNTYLRSFLELEGHTVSVAEDLKAAVTAVETDQFDVILSDITLPDGDGWSFLRSIRSKTPAFAIAMTGYSGEADIARSLAAGFQRHLTKPFSPKDLKRLLDEAAHHKAV